MSHTVKKEIDKIPLGSADVFVVKWTGEIPDNAALEVESNMIGRTKNGVTVNYAAEWYNVKSDDGKARRRKLVGEEASIAYGNITWNGETIRKLAATARSTQISDGTRKTKIGGIENDKEEKYLIRVLHRDKVAGNIRVTAVGVNTGGVGFGFLPNSESLVNAQFECDTIDDEGTLLIYEEECIELLLGETDTAAATAAAAAS